MSTTLFGIPVSPFVRKVALTLEYKGIDYELDPLNPMEAGEDFRVISPLGKIPALRDDECGVSDSSVICQYLEERYPHPAMLPDDAAGRARARFLEEYADTRMGEVFGGKLFFERLIKPRVLGQPTDENAVAENLANAVPQVNDYLESVLPETGFLLGGAPGLADLAVASMLINARYADYEPPADRWPRLAAWFERFLREPVVAARLEAESGFVAPLRA